MTDFSGLQTFLQEQARLNNEAQTRHLEALTAIQTSHQLAMDTLKAQHETDLKKVARRAR